MGAPVSTTDAGNIVKWFSDLYRWVRRKVAADHRSLLGIRTRADLSLSGGYYAVVACAPSRKVKPRSHSVLIASAREIARCLNFDDQPTQSVGDTVQFYVRDSKQHVESALEVRSSGLVELLVRLAPEPTDGTGPTIDVIDFAKPIIELCEVTRERALRQLTRRRVCLDWYIGLTPYTATPTGQVTWSGLSFPGREPGGRAKEGRSACPVGGLAAEALRSTSRWKRPKRVVERALRDLLETSGYYDFDGAVADTVGALDRFKKSDRLGRHG